MSVKITEEATTILTAGESQHAKQAAIPGVLTRLAAFLNSLKSTAEQWTDTERLTVILWREFAKFLRATAGPPALLASGISGM
ncbi:MAG: hypothetical protein ACYCRH_01330 [Acidiferrobacteraceae bacterium]